MWDVYEMPKGAIISKEMVEFLESCIQIDQSKRKSVEELKKLALFDRFKGECKYSYLPQSKKSIIREVFEAENGFVELGEKLEAKIEVVR